MTSEEVRPVVVWFTGLSGSGKSTLARWLASEMRIAGLKVEELDGDAIRARFPAIGFTRDERDAHIKRVGELASTLEQNGVSVVASLISPYEESRRFVRGLCRNFVEIYVSTPLDVCEQRDVKGLYARARAGGIVHFTGIDDPYEPPASPELVLDTSDVSVEHAGVRILEVVRRSIGAPS
jgi:adenylylsulfate kinase